MHQRGVLAVLLIRQLPMAAFYNNLLLGLTPVNHRDFWIGSFLGYLPMGVTASLLGAGMIQADAAQAARYMLSPPSASALGHHPQVAAVLQPLALGPLPRHRWLTR